jgi:hypothetical protein
LPLWSAWLSEVAWLTPLWVMSPSMNSVAWPLL